MQGNELVLDCLAPVLGGCAWGVEGVVECGGPEALLVAGAGEVPPEPEVEGGYDFPGPGVVWSVSGYTDGFGDFLSCVGVESVMLCPVGLVEPGFVGWPLRGLCVEGGQLVVHRVSG